MKRTRASDKTGGSRRRHCLLVLSIVVIIVVYVYFFKRFRVLTRQLSLCLELSEGQRDHSTCFDLSAVSISNVMLTVLLIAGTFGSTSGFWLALQFINFGTESKLADCSFTLCRAFGPGASQIIQSRKKNLQGTVHAMVPRVVRVNILATLFW